MVGDKTNRTGIMHQRPTNPVFKKVDGILDLKSCPFCGCSHIHAYSRMHKETSMAAHIQCTQCRAQIAKVNLQEAIVCWNKRV